MSWLDSSKSSWLSYHCHELQATDTELLRFASSSYGRSHITVVASILADFVKQEKTKEYFLLRNASAYYQSGKGYYRNPLTGGLLSYLTYEDNSYKHTLKDIISTAFNMQLDRLRDGSDSGDETQNGIRGSHRQTAFSFSQYANANVEEPEVRAWFYKDLMKIHEPEICDKYMLEALHASIFGVGEVHRPTRNITDCLIRLNEEFGIEKYIKFLELTKFKGVRASAILDLFSSGWPLTESLVKAALSRTFKADTRIHFLYQIYLGFPDGLPKNLKEKFFVLLNQCTLDMFEDNSQFSSASREQYSKIHEWAERE